VAWEVLTGMSLNPQVHEPFRCDLVFEGERVRLRPKGEIDLGTVPEVATHLSELTAAGFKQGTLDLRSVCFLDSTGLRMILEWDARSRADGFAFSLVAGPPTVQRLFDLTDTTRRLPFIEG
jgi:anti-sigma B factor antagonist